MPRRRTLLIITACLIGGAVINVLVAWGCTWCSIAYTSAKWRQLSLKAPCDWPVAVPTEWPPQALQAEARSTFGSMCLAYTGYDPEWTWRQGSGIGERNMYTIWEHRSGWPLRSMASGRLVQDVVFDAVAAGPGRFDIIAPSTFSGRLYQGRYPPQWMKPRNSPIFLMPVIPLLPIATGFIANTLIYASILWLAFVAPGVIRLSRRRRRGLCLACGYDLAALPRCPECGTVRTAGDPKSESRGTIVPRLPPR